MTVIDLNINDIWKSYREEERWKYEIYKWTDISKSYFAFDTLQFLIVFAHIYIHSNLKTKNLHFLINFATKNESVIIFLRYESEYFREMAQKAQNPNIKEKTCECEAVTQWFGMCTEVQEVRDSNPENSLMRITFK